MDAIDTIGFVAATLTTSAFLPQVLKIWHSRLTKDLSLQTLVTFIVGLRYCRSMVCQLIPVR